MSERMEKPLIPKTSIELELEELEKEQAAKLAAERPVTQARLNSLVAEINARIAGNTRFKITPEMRKEAKRNEYTDGDSVK